MNTSTHTTAPATAAHGRAKVAAVDPVRAWLWVSASLALATGGLHVVAAAQHVQPGGLVVGFFLLVTLAQVGGGLWLALHAVTRMQPDRRLVLAALAATVGLVALFVVASSPALSAGSRTPPAPHAGHTAPAGPFAAGLPTIASNAQIRETPGIL